MGSNNKKANNHWGVIYNTYILLVYFLNKYISKIHIFLSFHILILLEKCYIFEKQLCMFKIWHSITAFIKSPWTHCDFTRLLKEALHTIFPSHSQGLHTGKKTSDSAGRYDANPSTTQYAHRRKTSPWLWIRGSSVDEKCNSEILHIWGAMEGNGAYFSPVTATYCLELALRTD